jgi:site-specific DNA-methyltransferase (adenine-specific)
VEVQRNQVIQGDCLEVMKSIPDGSIDMILCDLPYGTTACKWDSIIPFEPLWEQYKRIIKTGGGGIILTASQPFTTALINSNIRNYKYEWIWVKNKSTNFVHAKTSPLRKHESILVFSKSGERVNYNPQGLREHNITVQPSKLELKEQRIFHQKNQKPYIRTHTGYPVSVLEFNVQQEGIHPTQKPVALFEYLIKTYTNPGELVLDNCAGSFTTAIACINTDRNYICIEKDETYCEIGRKRIEEHLKLTNPPVISLQTISGSAA